MRPERLRRDHGVSLIEVVVALGIFSVVIISLVGMMFSMARQARLTAYGTARTAAVQSASAWAQSVPWDNLGTSVGCVADSAGPLRYTRCTTVQDIGYRLKRLQVVVLPDSAAGVHADTVTVDRNKPQQLSPLYLP
jgi:type II secretory pathway pseudopilin PulG